MQLVIVESPAKAKTIEKYLGKDFTVLASYGHIRDLPPKDGSVRPDEDFAMDWELYGDKASRVKAITDAAKAADIIIRGVEKNRARVLVGNDAKALDLWVRLVASGYQPIAARVIGFATARWSK